MVNWLKGLRSSADSSLVILEIGCGTVIRNPRNRTEHELEVNSNAALIRINLHESDVDVSDMRQIAIPLRAEEALLALEDRLHWCAACPHEFPSDQRHTDGLISEQDALSETAEDFEWEAEAGYEDLDLG
mmetsp:Transcript_162358/g.311719  ORF Transcript_162358/g.311719 Transcript_162358/m.311719 type:complete len:130 (-) Transcript_162358:132-521(-)